jgi:malonate transporter
MTSILAPIFALILLGYLARRYGVLGAASYVELNRYVVFLALPALLFDVVAHLDLVQLDQPGFIATYAIGSIVPLVLPLWIGRRGRAFADAALDGLSAGYPNTGYVGIPLALLAFGPAGNAQAAIAATMTVCVIFGVAVALIEYRAHREHPFLVTLMKVAGSVLRNPMVAGPLAGIAFAATGFTLPAPVDRGLILLGGSAGPCALVALGLFLARDLPARGAQPSPALPLAGAGASLHHGLLRPVLLTVAKLLVQPGLTWLLAASAFHLAALDLRIVVLLSALPTGTGAFMLAEYYHRDPSVTARTILFSTIASVVTLALWLKVLGTAG